MKQAFLTRTCTGFLAAVTFSIGAADSRLDLNINPAWRFRTGEQPGSLRRSQSEAEAKADQPWSANFDDSAWDLVSLPHSHELFSASVAGFQEHGRETGWYRRQLEVPSQWLDKRVFIEFRGAMQTTTLWVNGKTAGTYSVSGYDTFSFDITQFLHGGTNLLAVQVDNRPNNDIPPDGQRMDYILFGGLYRDVFLHVTDPVHLTFPWESAQSGIRLTCSSSPAAPEQLVAPNSDGGGSDGGSPDTRHPSLGGEAAIVEAESTVRNDSDQIQKCTLRTEVRDKEGKQVAAGETEHEITPGAQFTFSQNLPPINRPHLWSPDNPYLYRVHTIVSKAGHEIDRQQTALGIRWTKFDKQAGFSLNGRPLKLIGANRHESFPFIGNAVPDGLQRRDAEQLKAMGVNWVRLSHYPQDPAFLDALDELGLMALEEPPTWSGKGGDKWMANLEASFRSMIRRDRNHPSIILWSTCINHHAAEPALVRAAKEEDPTRERGQDTVYIPMAFTFLNVPGNGSLATEHTGHMFPTQRGARAMTSRPRNAPRGVVETNINREFEQAERHLRQVNAAYAKPDNAGLAVWCMYDYNTFHNVNEPGMVYHGVCDLFRIPKFSYYWHQSELTGTPMAYIVRIDSTHAAVFSNCERVRLWQNAGEGYKELATQSPDTSFTTSDGHTISYALHHPPFSYTVSALATALKAEGLVGGSVRATYELREPGKPVALALEADRPSITADGADLSRIIVTAVDTNGTPVDTSKASVTFTIEGLGQLIGENPVKVRTGKMIILAQSGFAPSDLEVTATSPGLRSAHVTVKTLPVGPNVDLPKTLPALQPTKRSLVPRVTSVPSVAAQR